MGRRQLLSPNVRVKFTSLVYLVASTWEVPPGTIFRGYNITDRNEESYGNLKTKPSTYVDFNSVLVSGKVTEFQYYIDAGGETAAQGQFTHFQIWKVIDTSFLSGVPSNYTIELVYSLRRETGTTPGVYRVSHGNHY